MTATTPEPPTTPQPALLPPGWAWTTLGEVGRVTSGGTPAASDETNFGGEIAWVTPADLTGYTRKHISQGRRNLSEKGYASCSATLVEAGTVLFSSRAPIGYVAIAENPISTNQGFKNLTPFAGIFPDYVYHYLKSAKPLAESHASGTTFLELSGAKFAALPFPLPPFPEQQRIVTRIEELFSKLDAGVAGLKRTQALLKRYRQSLLHAAVTGELSREWRGGEDADWIDQTYKIGEMGVVITGGTPKKDMRGGPGTIPFFKPSELDAGYFVNTASELVTEAAAVSVRPIPERTVMVTCIGATIGKTGLSRTAGITNQQINSVVCDETLVSPEYLYFLLVSPQGQASISGGASSTTLPILNKSRFSNLGFPLPPLPEQAYIVSEVERRLSVLDNLEATVAAELKRAEATRQSVLHQAFTGGLVPQDPTDEPASVLLERIQAEKVKAGAAAIRAGGKRGRKPKGELLLPPSE